MTQPKDTVQSIYFKGYTNQACEFIPCHKGVRGEFNCLFCYCPLAYLECVGPYKVFTDKHGQRRKDCSSCKLPHDGYEKSWNFIQHALEHPVSWSGHWPLLNMLDEDLQGGGRVLVNRQTGERVIVDVYGPDEVCFTRESTGGQRMTVKQFRKIYKDWVAE